MTKRKNTKLKNDKHKPYIIIDRERCKGCNLCVIYCPKNVILLSRQFNAKGYHPAMINAECENECTGCGFCYIVCPDTAIEVHKKC